MWMSIRPRYPSHRAHTAYRGRLWMYKVSARRNWLRRRITYQNPFSQSRRSQRTADHGEIDASHFDKESTARPTNFSNFVDACPEASVNAMVLT